MKTVTIAIPSLHRPDLTARCIASIQQQTIPRSEWEIVVIENEAQAGSVLAEPLPANTQRIDLDKNEGTTGSINRAVGVTESEYILLLNNDVELKPDYMEKLVAVLRSNPRLGFATGKLLRATQPTHLDGAGDALLSAGAAYRLGHFDIDAGQYDTPMAIASGCGAAVLYRRNVFEACGRLDDDFFAYLDDVDLGLRAQLIGYGGTYVPDAVAYHIGSATLGDRLHPHIIEYLTRNQLFLLLKDYPRAVLRRLLPRVIVYQCLWLLFALRNGGSGAYRRGVLSAIRQRGIMKDKHRRLMAVRHISDEQFLTVLRESEQQVRMWQAAKPQSERSGLLRLYFRLFKT